MSAYDNPYSRLVAWLKIILPLAALALLSTMFLLSRTHESIATLPFTQVDMAELAEEQRVRAPTYAAMTRDGSALSVTAQSARPDVTEQNIIHAVDLHAVIETENGSLYDIVSDRGRIDNGNALARLIGSVVVETSRGEVLTTDALTTSLEETFVESDADVVITAPEGTIEAGKMILTGPNHLLFKDGVKVIYTSPTD